jgi:hypothetical protein
MTLREAAIDEERWSPIALLVWIAARSRRFVEALKDLPLALAEDGLWRLRRDNCAPYAISLGDALNAFRGRPNAAPRRDSSRRSAAKMTARLAHSTSTNSRAWILRFRSPMRSASGPAGAQVWRGILQRRGHGGRRRDFPERGSGAFQTPNICPSPMSSMCWRWGPRERQSDCPNSRSTPLICAPASPF